MGAETKIVCPVCGSVLRVQADDGINEKFVTCPVCKQRRKFKEYRIVTDNNEPTQYAGMNQSNAVSTGVLIIQGHTYNLRLGKNIVGRKGNTSKADIQLPCENNRISREHICINVKQIPANGLVHTISLYKQQVNDTFVEDLKLEFGDSMILEHGMTIHLPDVDIRFELPNEESTQL